MLSRLPPPLHRALLKIGQPVRLDLMTADGSLRPWSGHVTGFALLGWMFLKTNRTCQRN